ncbi:hypothetical protein CLOM_g9944 [Closterium sp. NIES-68]|nr:hypothetical protein CLOM_g9944 [Closterium sp. NIES-68]GJP68458.1 hypothetical protein CLOP_g25164 [Closterium sp. NIES-67]GJP87076.1 hypothetical protein CLOP_g17047 [Closterium sp. NIES-67]
MPISRAALSAALLACLFALLALSPASAAAQSAFLVAKAKTLRAAADQAAADLKVAQADAAKHADEVAAATQALIDLQGPDPTLDNLVSSVSDVNGSLADAQYDLDIANKILVLRVADLAAFKADPSKHPQIPAAQKAVSDAIRRASMTSALLQEWKVVVAEAAQTEADAQKAVNENPSEPATLAALAEAQDLRKSVEEVFPDMVAQDQRAQARLARTRKELNDLVTLGPQGESVFQMAVDDAKAAVSVARQVYDDTFAAVVDAQQSISDYQTKKEKAVADAKASLAKGKQSQAITDKKLTQLTDKLKAALVQADNAEKAAGISKAT